MLISVSDLQCNVCFYWNSFCQIHVPSGVQKNALRKLVVNVMTFFSTIYAAQNYEQSSRPTGHSEATEGACIYYNVFGFEGSFWQICKILRY